MESQNKYREITLNEVRQHNKSDDLWMVISNKVYNLSTFLKEHPGGEDPLIENAGQDATKQFIEVGHSREAEEMMKKYCVGNLAEADKNQDKFIRQYGKEIGLAVTAVILGFLSVYLIKRTLINRN